MGFLFCFFAIMHGILMVLATISGDIFHYFLRLGMSRMRGETHSPNLCSVSSQKHKWSSVVLLPSRLRASQQGVYLFCSFSSANGLSKCLKVVVTLSSLSYVHISIQTCVLHNWGRAVWVRDLRRSVWKGWLVLVSLGPFVLCWCCPDWPWTWCYSALTSQTFN